MALAFPSEVWADVLSFAAGLGEEPERMTTHERAQLRETRLAVVQVCRGWKRASTKYLYNSPIINTSASLIEFSASLHSADARWDNLRRSPFSLPGAYVRTLDISHLRPSNGALSSPFADIQNQPWQLNLLVCNLLPVLPFLTKLVLPPGAPGGRGGGPLLGGGMFLRALRGADCSNGLKVLENLGMLMNGVVDGEGKDPVVALLEGLPSLETLSLVGGGGMDLLPDDVTPEIYPQPVLTLQKLHTLHLKGVQTGLLLQALIHSSLPSLQHLSLSSYHTAPLDLTTPLLAAHGPSLLSLTYLTLPDFPRPVFPLPVETLSLCPSLLSLSLNTPPNQPPPPPEFFANASSSSSRLETISLPRPSNPAHYEGLVRALSALPRLRTLMFQGFTFLPAGSSAAMSAGLNGTVRGWATLLGRKGVAVRDSRKKTSPGLVETKGIWFVDTRKVSSPRATRVRRSSWDEEESEGGG